MRTGEPEKNPRVKNENQQQTEPTFVAGLGIRTRATFIGGETLKTAPFILPQFWQKL